MDIASGPPSSHTLSPGRQHRLSLFVWDRYTHVHPHCGGFHQTLLRRQGGELGLCLPFHGVQACVPVPTLPTLVRCPQLGAGAYPSYCLSKCRACLPHLDANTVCPDIYTLALVPTPQSVLRPGGLTLKTNYLDTAEHYPIGDTRRLSRDRLQAVCSLSGHFFASLCLGQTSGTLANPRYPASQTPKPAHLMNQE